MPDENAPSDDDDIADSAPSEARYRAVFEHCSDAMLLTNGRGRILSANAAACALFAYSMEELLARNVSE